MSFYKEPNKSKKPTSWAYIRKCDFPIAVHVWKKDDWVSYCTDGDGCQLRLLNHTIFDTKIEALKIMIDDCATKIETYTKRIQEACKLF